MASKLTPRGRFIHQLRFVQSVMSIDPTTGGQIVGSPVVIADGVPGRIEPVSVQALVREQLSAGALTNVATHVVKTDYRTDLSVANRIEYDDANRAVTRVFEITAMVNVEERDIELHVLCAERVS
jgi:head-tail adaptor